MSKKIFNRKEIESFNMKLVSIVYDGCVIYAGRLEVRNGYVFIYLNKFSGNEYRLKFDYRKPKNRAKIDKLCLSEDANNEPVDDYDEDADDFQSCDECDLPDACADFGCAVKQGIRRINIT